jgi:hypothetical protein
MGTIKVKPATDAIMVAFVLTAMPAFVPGHAMKDFNLDAGKEVRDPISGHKCGVSLKLHNLFDGLEVQLIWSEGGCRTAGDKPGRLIATQANLFLQWAKNRIRIRLINKEQISTHSNSARQ